MIKDIIAANETVKPNRNEMEILHTHFPQCFNADGEFDIDKFQELIKDSVGIAHEGYDLNFLGKSYAKLLASIDTTTIIIPDEEHNSKPENINSKNIYISGDNLDGLKHLLKSYSGKVKCIYIDPPYNTGSDGFVYNDNFNFTSEELQTKLSISEEQANKILDLTKRGSASHSAWLMFMASRLQLAKDLLTDDGVIFISIDDNEQANLKLLCDSIFGEENIVAQLVWEQGKKSMAAQIAINHEYCLVYCKEKDKNIIRIKSDESNGVNNTNWCIRKQGLEAIYDKYEELATLYSPNYPKIEEELAKFYRNLPDNNASKAHCHYKKVDERGIFFPDNISQGTGNGGRFDILHPTTNLPCSVPSGGWGFSEDKLPELLRENRIYFGIDHTTVPCLKRYLKETEYEVFASVFYKDGRGATKRLESLMGEKVFDHPKDEDVISTLIHIATQDGDNDKIVLDFFSGSATTGHAIMANNASDGNKVQYILIQLPENLDDSYMAASTDDKKKIKKVIDFLDSIERPHNLDEVGIERLKRAAAKIKDETGADIDYGFKHYTLAEPTEDTLSKLESFDSTVMFDDNTILNEFGAASVLETWKVRDGYGFGAKSEAITLDKYTAYYIDKHLYLVDSGFTENDMVALIDKYNNDGEFNPEQIVVFGYSFTFSTIEMLKSNLATLREGAKNLKVNIDIRY